MKKTNKNFNLLSNNLVTLFCPQKYLQLKICSEFIFNYSYVKKYNRFILQL